MLCTIFPPFSPSYCTSHPPTPQYLISHSRHWVISSHLFPLLYICQPLTLFPSFRCFSPSIRRCLAQASFNGLNSSINYCWNFNSTLLCNISQFHKWYDWFLPVSSALPLLPWSELLHWERMQ